MQELKGSFVALVTPMKSNGEIDFPALKELVEWHIEVVLMDCIRWHYW